jgi:hypothetical protein
MHWGLETDDRGSHYIRFFFLEFSILVIRDDSDDAILLSLNLKNLII